MRGVQASDAKTHLLQLLDAVERGETIVITRHGRPIARLVPEAERRQAETRATIEALKALRRTGPKLSAEEIRACSSPLIAPRTRDSFLISLGGIG